MCECKRARAMATTTSNDGETAVALRERLIREREEVLRLREEALEATATVAALKKKAERGDARTLVAATESCARICGVALYGGTVAIAFVLYAALASNAIFLPL